MKPEVSMFDPFSVDASSRLNEWLSDRYKRDGDEEIIDLVIPLGNVFDFRSRADLFLFSERLGRVIPSLVLSRRFRTARGSIGLHECDLITALDRALIGQISVVRAILTLIGVAFGLLAALSPPYLVLLALLGWTIIGSGRRLAIIFAAAVLGLVAWREPLQLMVFVPVAVGSVLVRPSITFLRRGFLPVLLRGSPLRFLGPWPAARTLFSQRWAAVALAVDKATHDDRSRATVFIDKGFEGAPAKIKPVLVQCQALVASANLEHQTALRLAEEARRLAASQGETIRGWCALFSGDVLHAAGQLEAAQVHWAQALRLLDDDRRSRYWVTEAKLRTIEALTSDPDDAERCIRGLQVLQPVRERAVRLGDIELVDKTELHLLRLMHAAGNTTGSVVHLARQYDLSKGKVGVGSSIPDYCRQTLLLATLYLEVIDNPSRFPDAEVHEEAGAFAMVAELLDNVLRRLSGSTEPLLEAYTFATLARIQFASKLYDDALGNILESLNIVQQVRYQLPTAAWRSQWVASHAESYGLALDLAVRNRPALVAELLEVVRAQSVPLDRSEESESARSIFDALLASTMLPNVRGIFPRAIGDEGETFEATRVPEPQPGHSDPLLTDKTILVQRASWVGGSVEGAIDLDREIETMVPQGWYWTFARASQWVYHAVRMPTGDWIAERSPYADLEEPLLTLLEHLPSMPLYPKGPEAPRQQGLMKAPTVGVGAEGLVTAREMFAQVFGKLGAALLPQALQAALSAASHVVPVAVAPTGVLSVIPICALPIDDRRMVLDVAALVHVPSIALIAHRRMNAQQLRQSANHAQPEREVPPVVAVLAPDRKGLAGMRAMDGSRPDRGKVLEGPVTLDQLAVTLRERPVQVLQIVSHVDCFDPQDPGRSGARFADGYLNLHQLYRTDEGGRMWCEVPRNVVLTGCTSLGVHVDVTDPQRRTADRTIEAPEWLGFGAAMVYAGAAHVLCTIFPLPISAQSARISKVLTNAMSSGQDSVQALRLLQREELDRWLDGGDSIPLTVLSLAYVGLGGSVVDSPLHRLTAVEVDDTKPRERLSFDIEPSTSGETAPGDPHSVSAGNTPISSAQPQSIDAIGRRGLEHKIFKEFLMLTISEFGSIDNSYDQLFPRLTRNGNIHFSDADGSIQGPIQVEYACWRRWIISTDLFNRDSVEWRISRANLYITDARIILERQKQPTSASRMIGHLRYPWITSIGYRPKQSLLNDCGVVITIQQEIEEPREAQVVHELSIFFPPSFDSGGLAQELARRLSRHHLMQEDLPDSVVSDFEALSSTARLPAPPKGDYSYYYPQAFKLYPYGTEYVLGNPPEGKWRGPRL
ncbi:CHAT domain-containing protein [Glycomyces sp. NPDC021274]|uniref:CHAT domain-containing protein n=1 Tax=Glycomyces sp. NPDC021274 TaxID=3155120 RepID=UPI0033CE3077